MSHKDDNWIAAYKALDHMAHMWPLGPNHYDVVVEALITLVDSRKRGVVGRDLAWKVRRAFQYGSREGWNEDSTTERFEGEDILDGMHAALSNNAFQLYHMAIDAMFEATENGDHERAATLHTLIEEYLNAPIEWGEQPITVDITANNIELSNRITEAYGNKVIEMPYFIQGKRVGTKFMPVNRARLASNANAGYLLEETAAAEDDEASSSMLCDECERVPIYLEPDDYDQEEIDMILQRIGDGGVEWLADKLSNRWNGAALLKLYDGLERLSVLCTRLTDKEKVLFSRELVNRMCEGQPWHRWWLFNELLDKLDVDVADDFIELLVSGWSREVPDELPRGSSKDVESLYELVEVAPGQKGWTAWNDRRYLRPSGVFNTRRSYKACDSAGWASYRRTGAQVSNR